jgi:hypothetical protein
MVVLAVKVTRGPALPGFATILAVVLLLLMSRSAAAQSISAPALKAGYLFNFAKFVDWPTRVMTVDEPLVLCVDNDPGVADALERTIKGRAIKGRGLVARRVLPSVSLSGCHILYVGGEDPKRAARAADCVKGEPVFTVSDAPGFAANAGIVELFLEDERIRIAVNVDALQRAHVRLSSRVLELAKIVRD